MIGILNKESRIIKLWDRIGKNVEDLEREIELIVQQELLKELRPTKKQITLWKASANGRKEFFDYITKRIGYLLSQGTIDALWRYYTNRTINKRDKKLILEFKKESKGKCSHCGSTKGPFEIDHIVPLAKGGQDSSDNLQCLCMKCNRKKGSKLDKYYNIFSLNN